jgi:hypothetical protein
MIPALMASMAWASVLMAGKNEGDPRLIGPPFCFKGGDRLTKLLVDGFLSTAETSRTFSRGFRGATRNQQVTIEVLNRGTSEAGEVPRQPRHHLG